jgi:hypothetical protein
MLKTTRHILKADEVAFDDPFHLGIDPSAQPRRMERQCASAAPSVRVAQNHPQYAVIEVTCPCGQTTYIRCEYAPKSQ